MGVSPSPSSWGSPPAPSLLRGSFSPWALVCPYILAAGLMPAAPAPLQEMLAIMKSIYDMMGRHTYPVLREDAPVEHVERFFQVRTLALDPEKKGGWGRDGLTLLGQPWAGHSPSLSPPLPTRRLTLHPSPGWLSGSRGANKNITSIPQPTEPPLGAC